MEKELYGYVAERAEILATAGSSKQETKEAAQAWLDAVDEATTKLLDFLEGRPKPIDSTIAFAQGRAVELFGEEAAAQMLAKQLARKEQGAKYCDCPSCAAASELLGKFGRIEL